MQTFAERLHILIDYKNISQKRFAEETKFNEGQISNWLSGNIKAPRRTTIREIADYFGCNIEWLATGEGEPFHIDDDENDNSLCLAMEEDQDDHYSFYGESESGKRQETTETESKMVRTYRKLAEMDADILKEIQTWLNDMDKLRPGFTGWFRLEFQNRFPEFDEWKNNVLNAKKKKDLRQT